ncbi:hypothetical protein AAHA92_02660 [Salvia divinorum]|uniref:Uncharacterized protein n=1 Tax=Salvia divinorum TaxID=28513 RepID=A0ABD1IIN8_SALDI
MQQLYVAIAFIGNDSARFLLASHRYGCFFVLKLMHQISTRSEIQTFSDHFEILKEGYLLHEGELSILSFIHQLPTQEVGLKRSVCWRSSRDGVGFGLKIRVLVVFLKLERDLLIPRDVGLSFIVQAEMKDVLMMRDVRRGLLVDEKLKIPKKEHPSAREV